jgi:hypothetical protein
VIKELQTILPAPVKKFMQQEAFDKIVSTCLLYFIASFEKNILSQGLERAQKQHLDGYSQIAVEAKMAELDRDIAGRKAALSPLYAMVWYENCTGSVMYLRVNGRPFVVGADRPKLFVVPACQS